MSQKPAFNKESAITIAESYIKQNNLAAAIEKYREIVDLEPDNVLAKNRIGDLYLRLGENGAAVNYFNSIAEQYCESKYYLKAIAMYKKINKFAPDSTLSSLKLAELYFTQKLYADARQQCDKVVDRTIDAEDVNSQKALLILKSLASMTPCPVDQIYKLATKLEAQNSYQDASAAYFEAGRAFVTVGRTNESIEAFKRSLMNNPDSKTALRELIKILTQVEGLDRALSMISNLLGQQENEEALLLLMGRAYLHMNMLTEAENMFARVLEQDRSKFENIFEVAQRYLLNREFDKLIAIVDKCLDAMILNLQGNKVKELLERVVQVDPAYLPAYKRLTYLFTKLNDYHRLTTTLKKIIQMTMAAGLKSEAEEAMKQLLNVNNFPVFDQEQTTVKRSTTNAPSALPGTESTIEPDMVELDLSTIIVEEEEQVTRETPNIIEFTTKLRFDTQLDVEWRRGARHKFPISLIIIEVNLLQSVNQPIEIAAEATFFQNIKTVLTKQIMRPGDVVIHYSDSTFGIVLPHTDGYGGQFVADKLRDCLETFCKLETGFAQAKKAKICFGTASAKPSRNSSKMDMISLAQERINEDRRSLGLDPDGI